MIIRLNKAHFPVTALGPGRRIGLWLQGCHVRCPGCISRDTWDPDPRREVELDQVLAWCCEIAADGIDGVTISGGEPFEQPQALAVLLDGLHAWRGELHVPFDILCYSGFPFRRLEHDYPDILGRLDALVPEPYIDRLPGGGIWRGSSNQPLVLLTPLGRERYESYITKRVCGKGPLQVSVTAEGVWFIGIPARGDMQRLEATARRQGVILGGQSWLA